MGDFANGLVIAILAVAAVVFLVLWIRALRGIFSAGYTPMGVIIWTAVVTFLLPAGLVLWFVFGKRDSGTERELRRLRRWDRERQVDTTVEADLA